jgi:4-amino-4-deoxy-L-arabinose transferase-like glycosyltransferase
MTLPRARAIHLAVAAGVAIAVGWLYLSGLGASAYQNGDEAIYAQMVREMIRTGDYLEARWFGTAQHARPPWGVARLVGYCQAGRG